MENKQVEVHPLGFFLPKPTHVLMLGSFPPGKKRWSMNFFYPNIQNDMWRILGSIFFADKDYFLTESKKAFCEERAKSFSQDKGIGFGDTAMEVIRQKENASDKFLEVVTASDMKSILAQIPECRALVITGQKAMDTLLSVLSFREPKVGSYAECSIAERSIRIYRMPSSSRAYPKPLPEKMAAYKQMFDELSLLQTAR